VSDLLQRWPADALRAYLGSHHYRKVWAHDPEELRQAGQMAARIRRAATATGGQRPAVDAAAWQRRFTSALEADLDTPAAMAALDELAAVIIAGGAAGQQLEPAQAALRQMSQIFGLRLDASSPEDRVTAGWNEHLSHSSV
jgi:cysteinyl-tRNA synthetase